MSWSPVIVRRRGLGRGSTRAIAALVPGARVVRADRERVPGAEQHEIAIRWGCTALVSQRTVLNPSGAIHRVNDKAGFRRLLMSSAIADCCCPRTWFDETAFMEEECSPGGNLAQPKYIGRPGTHSRGRNLYVLTTLPEVTDFFERYAERSPYISEFIPKTHEYRVFVVQGRVAWVANKTPADSGAVAWNVSLGGRFDNKQWGSWPLPVLRAAIAAFNLSGLDFGGVDVMWDENLRKAYVLEINSAASLTSPYRQQCVARCFNYIMERQDANHLSIGQGRDSWKLYIHPAISERAVLGTAGDGE